ncbi:hypothetical protein [Streptomyces sp. NPDC002164]|uniref:hypothetical protein n=1 Tax=Streptomyces sp. NPDC002164 TaxID=3364633 RepID=UPI0036AB2F3B
MDERADAHRHGDFLTSYQGISFGAFAARCGNREPFDDQSGTSEVVAALKVRFVISVAQHRFVVA